MKGDPRYKILRFEIPTKHNIELELPLQTKILTFQAQGTFFYIWAMINMEEKTTEKRNLKLIDTGRNLDFYKTNSRYIGTAQIANSIVFHLFEVYTGED